MSDESQNFVVFLKDATGVWQPSEPIHCLDRETAINRRICQIAHPPTLTSEVRVMGPMKGRTGYDYMTDHTVRCEVSVTETLIDEDQS